ncbi:MAG TPA: hypothetical protein VFB54_07025 [Burkholderiales bacterium]|nr:hypothetical protein [Burkholderiales bacterium]
MSTKSPRKYTLSDAALAQRRANQPRAVEAARDMATGPTTDEGKAASSRNGWKHGRYSAVNRLHFGLGAASVSKMFGKPCVTTCPYHPDNPERTEHPCSIVLDGITRAGGSCLDRSVYLHAVDAMMRALQDGEFQGINGVLVTELAGNLQIIDSIRRAIAEHGVYISKYDVDRDGRVILDPRTGQPMVFELKVNPAILALAKFTDTLGLNFAELMVTPRARAKTEDDDEKRNAVHALLAGIGARMGKRPPRQLEHEDDA